MRFSIASGPNWLRRTRWCTCRFAEVPQLWHFQPSRLSTRFLSWSYSSRLRTNRGRFWRNLPWALFYPVQPTDPALVRQSLIKSFQETPPALQIGFLACQILPKNRRRSSPGSSPAICRVPSIRAAVSSACSMTGNLAFVYFEIDDLPGLGLFTSQVALNLRLESFFGKFLRFVQPGCTVKLFPIFPRHFH